MRLTAHSSTSSQPVLPKCFGFSVRRWMVVLDVCHPVFNSSRGCDHHTQSRTGLIAHGRPSSDPRRVVCAQQCFLTCAHTHSVYVTCQPARKWNQTDARPGENLFLEGLISMEILIFFLPRKHWSSCSLSCV